MKERVFEPFFTGKGEYRSYSVSFSEHRQGVRKHNEQQSKSARNEMVLAQNKSIFVSRRARRRYA